MHGFILRSPKRITREPDRNFLEVCPLSSIFKKQKIPIEVENELIDDSYWCISIEGDHLKRLYDGWLVDNRGIRSTDEYYAAGGDVKQIHLYFYINGVRKKKIYGANLSGGEELSELHINKTNTEQ